MASIQVVNRQKSATSVAAAGETHAERVGTAVDKQLASCLAEGETVGPTAQLIRVTARRLARLADTMVKADEAHQNELADDDGFRAKRDEAAAKLYSHLVDQREWMGGLFGTGALKSLGFSSPTPQDPVMLERFAGEVVTRQSGTLPPAKRKDVKWSAAESNAEINGLRTELNTQIANVAREVREAQGTKLNRDAAVTAYDEAFGRTANLFVALFRFAGDEELATRVRPSSRRPGQTEENVEGEGSAPVEGGEPKPA